ncbi:MAG: 16S rRNA (guanine(527)-N(7))-methyltransferase RsmG [Acidobacteria bacterium]|nr:MAG: 16S rRNA (guanine(527)-N(7))-methyltransferase RsmG [Acidobacteriota bacterium]
MTTAISVPSVAVIRRALTEFSLPAYDDQLLQIQQYMKILLTWNEKVNLTAIRDPLEILHRHFCECMYAAEAISLEKGRLADVGSGGGFPGLALKIIRPGLQVFLVESNIKKVTFLAEVIRELGLKGAQVLARRYEELGEEIAPLEYICSRALGEFPGFLEWARSEQIAAKRVILWIGARDLSEIQSINTWEWQEPIPVPHSLRRLLLVGNKKSSSASTSLPAIV